MGGPYNQQKARQKKSRRRIRYYRARQAPQRLQCLQNIPEDADTCSTVATISVEDELDDDEATMELLLQQALGEEKLRQLLSIAV